MLSLGMAAADESDGCNGCESSNSRPPPPPESSNSRPPPPPPIKSVSSTNQCWSTVGSGPCRWGERHEKTQTGEQACENHGYTETECSSMGCCQWVSEEDQGESIGVEGFVFIMIIGSFVSVTCFCWRRRRQLAAFSHQQAQAASMQNGAGAPIPMMGMPIAVPVAPGGLIVAQPITPGGMPAKVALPPPQYHANAPPPAYNANASPPSYNANVPAAGGFCGNCGTKRESCACGPFAR